MTKQIPDQAGGSLPPAWTASWWLRLGQVAMFLGLLGIATVMAASKDAGWPIFVLAGLMLAVFLVGMVAAERFGPGARLVWVGALFVLNVALMLLSPDFLWVAFPLWMLAGAVLPLVAALLLTAVTLAVIITVLSMTGAEGVGAVLGPLVGAGVAVGLSRGVQQFEHEASEHRRLLHEVLRAQDEAEAFQREAGVLAERTRLAHDIHDTLAQGFSSLVLLARAAHRERDPQRALELLAQIETTASDNLAESRRVVYALAPNEGDGLPAALARLTQETGAAIGAEATFVAAPELPRLSTSTQVALLRAAQGSLANVRQHSSASRVAVELGLSDDFVLLDVVDDGVGFDPQRAPERPTLEGGYGLRALRERLHELGGRLTIESEPGGGTAVSVQLPLAVEP